MKAAKKKVPQDPVSDVDVSRMRVLGRGLRAKKGTRLPLRAMREGGRKTQADIAEAMGISQGVVSELERREDALVSTLRAYAKACGGELELVAVFPTGHRYTVILGT
jgi:hypothetical protein